MSKYIKVKIYIFWTVKIVELLFLKNLYLSKNTPFGAPQNSHTHLQVTRKAQFIWYQKDAAFPRVLSGIIFKSFTLKVNF